MNIFGIGLPEMGLIMIVALLVFGPKKLPEISRSLGGAIRDLQKASKQFEDEFKKESDAVEKAVVEPMKATLEKPRAIAPDASTAKASEPTEAEIVEAVAAKTEETKTEETEVAETEAVESDAQTA
ncbi:MAG: twin-arginine translocase TatA/TatE family subunit [Leptolyngbya foveolarum]|uniref:Sec-independent protein translocase protein TatA n=1 Tax=Leptolyngbya foveolarum TaxID=47253 RepID=A0A2W4V955_9CYAN|nr:MAG: twin-arginine translocase TatA/TatE family subunit [Leptolyngbya foveolarum]